LAVIADSQSEPFFAGLRAGELLIQHCQSCDGYQSQLPRRTSGTAACRSCGAINPEWVRAKGEGVVISWTTTAFGLREGNAGTGRRLAGIVELVEGPWLFVERGAGEAPVDVGTVVVLSIVNRGEPGEPVPVFVPLQPSAGRGDDDPAVILATPAASSHLGS
jgi:uncharacterized OB-fold protein